MKRPFRIGTTSFIYPDHILPNVRKIGRFFDEIELLIFESMPDTVLPDKSEIAELARLSEALDVTYNIHLPTDVSLTHPSARARQHAAETIARVVDLCRPLAPSTHTLHLEMAGYDPAEKIDAWQVSARDGLARLMRYVPNLEIFSVETLEYPPDCLMPFLTAYDLTVCLDVGHHFRYGYDLNHSVNIFQGRIAVMHLHGVGTVEQKIRDHIGLDLLRPDQLYQVMDLLKHYQGTVSLEVFNRSALDRSLAVLSDVFDDVLSRLPG
jgi:sugar phosphate isomerase/epimerase